LAKNDLVDLEGRGTTEGTGVWIEAGELLEHLHRYAYVEVNGEYMWVCRCGRPKPCG